MTDPFQALQLSMTNPDAAAEFLARNFAPPVAQATPTNPLALTPGMQTQMQQALTPSLQSLQQPVQGPAQTQQQEDLGDILASMHGAGLQPSQAPNVPLQNASAGGVDPGSPVNPQGTSNFVQQIMQNILGQGQQLQPLGAIIGG